MRKEQISHTQHRREPKTEMRLVQREKEKESAKKGYQQTGRLEK
jgi:hypothetical protein